MMRRVSGLMALLYALGWPALSWSQDSVTLARDDGRGVSLTTYPPQAAVCRGIALVSPGAGGSEKGYRFLGEGLSALGYLTVVMGHAESGARAVRERMAGRTVRDALADLITDPAPYAARRLDIEAARRWARETCPGGDALLVGHSMGAASTMIEAGARNKVQAQGANAFDAYIALSPQGAGLIFPAAAWSDIRRPVLMITGTRDDEIGGGSWETRAEPFANLPPGCVWLGVSEDTTHMNLAGIGDAQATVARVTATINAFLEALQAGKCGMPPRIDGMAIRARADR